MVFNGALNFLMVFNVHLMRIKILYQETRDNLSRFVPTNVNRYARASAALITAHVMPRIRCAASGLLLVGANDAFALYDC